MITPDQLQNRQAVPEVPELTERQAEILREIARHAEVTGEARASYVSRRLDMSRSTLRAHVEALVRKGWLRSAESPFRLRRPL